MSHVTPLPCHTLWSTCSRHALSKMCSSPLVIWSRMKMILKKQREVLVNIWPCLYNCLILLTVSCCLMPTWKTLTKNTTKWKTQMTWERTCRRNYRSSRLYELSVPLGFINPFRRKIVAEKHNFKKSFVNVNHVETDTFQKQMFSPLVQYRVY